MAERSNQTIWNEDVFVGKERTIAVRGLIPNYLGHTIHTDRFSGMLADFEHFETTTVVTILHRLTAPRDRRLVEQDLPHLAEIRIEY